MRRTDYWKTHPGPLLKFGSYYMDEFSRNRSGLSLDIIKTEQVVMIHEINMEEFSRNQSLSQVVT